jgi:hypothetical protein
MNVRFILYVRAATRCGMELYKAMDWARAQCEIDRKWEAECEFIRSM